MRGHITTTTAKIVVRSDTDGVVTLSGSGFTGDSATADTATATDGVVTLTATGLSANTEYTGSITHVDGSSEAAKFKTAPESGSFDVVWMSCQVSQGWFDLGAGCALDASPIAAFELGDIPYTNAAKVGVEDCASTDSSLVNATDQAVYNCQYRHAWRNPGWKKLRHETAIYKIEDDHGWPGGDWDHSITNASKDGLPTMTQVEADSIFAAGKKAMSLYCSGNPDNTDAESGNEYPKYAGVSTVDGSTPESNYFPDYCRWSIADCEFFLIDCITHRSNVSSTDNSDKTMLGATQLAWLKKYLYESTKTFKVLLSSKAARGTVNPDCWQSYRTEIEDLFKFLSNATRSSADQATYGTDDITGFIMLSGDQHTPHVSRASVAEGDSYTYLDVCACPVGATINNVISGVAGERVWVNASSPVYGHLHIEGSEYMEARIVALDGKILWRGRIYAGSNDVVYPHARPAVA